MRYILRDCGLVLLAPFLLVARLVAFTVALLLANLALAVGLLVVGVLPLWLLTVHPVWALLLLGGAAYGWTAARRRHRS